jgi:hypothetical protein
MSAQAEKHSPCTAQAEKHSPCTAQAEKHSPCTAQAEKHSPCTAQAEKHSPCTAQAEKHSPCTAQAEKRAPYVNTVLRQVTLFIPEIIEMCFHLPYMDAHKQHEHEHAHAHGPSVQWRQQQTTPSIRSKMTKETVGDGAMRVSGHGLVIQTIS